MIAAKAPHSGGPSKICQRPWAFHAQRSAVPKLVACFAATLIFALQAHAELPQTASFIGDEHEISKCYKTSNQASDKSSSGSSRGCDTILERVIGEREDGWEFEYDLRKEATSEDRAREWIFPARVLRTANGTMELLNKDELETRLEDWLEKAKWTREVCGRWIFTWNAFHIDCEPESVLDTIGTFDIVSADLRDGVPFELAEASGPGLLAKKKDDHAGARYEVVLDVDPDAVHRARAENAVVVGEISNKPITLKDALQEQSEEIVSGTISVTFETDAAGAPMRRIMVTKLKTQRPDGVIETDVRTETIERRPIPERSAGQ